MTIRSAFTRRRFLAAAGIAVAGTALPVCGRAQPAGEKKGDGFRVLRARRGSVALLGAGKPETAIWGYDGGVPGPVLRVRQGEEVKVRLVNELPEATVVHWHGLRLPNAMDGVPHLTQSEIVSGASFDYVFRAPDAGTFWYHSHLYSSEQLERGLYGALIVEEPVAVDVDHDVLLVLDDWRLTSNGAIDEASFRSMHDAAHAGRLGRLLTANSQKRIDIPVKPNARLRLRLVNAANARVIPVRIDNHAARVMAIDGQPAQPFLASSGEVRLGPGNRVDLFIDANMEVGDAAAIVVDDYGRDVEIARLVYDRNGKARETPRPEPAALPANPLPERMDFRSALRSDMPIEGGAMSTMMMGRGGREIPGHGLDPRARIWTLAGQASSGHHGPPLFSIKRGRTAVIAFANRTAFAHAMHLHGHHFRLLDSLDDGWKPYWLDTVTVEHERTARIAFVADNPGKWMIHCHMLEHQETGMAAWFEVT